MENLKLTNYYQTPISSEVIKEFEYPGLCHLRTGDDYKGTIFHSKYRMSHGPIGEVIAFVNVRISDNCIQALEVNPDFRSKGFGKQLLKYAEEKLGANKLTVRDTNKVAQTLYKSNGWVETGKSGWMIEMVKEPKQNPSAESFTYEQKMELLKKCFNLERISK